MISRRDLIEAIEECEKEPITFQSCEKLATLFIVYDHLYGEVESKPTAETIIGKWGESDFLSTIADKNAEKVWQIVDELVSSVQALYPRLYDAFMAKFE